MSGFVNKRGIALVVCSFLAISIGSCFLSGCSSSSSETAASSRGSESILFERAFQDASSGVVSGSLMMMDGPGDSPRSISDEVWGPLAKSPDGEKVAYVSYPYVKLLNLSTLQSEDIYEMDTSQGLYQGDQVEDMSWAPDGNSIYLFGTFKKDKEEAYTAGIRLLTLKDGSLKEIALAVDMGTDFSAQAISISPSGKRILFSMVGAIYLAEISKNSILNTQEIVAGPTTDSPDLPAPRTIPIWLNDSEITFIETYPSPRPEGWSSRLVKMDVDSGEKTTLMESDWENNMVIGWVFRSFYPLACSPDGTRIIFPVLADVTQAPEGEIAITPLYMINSDGTGLTKITYPEKDGAASGDIWPCWASR